MLDKLVRLILNLATITAEYIFSFYPMIDLFETTKSNIGSDTYSNNITWNDSEGGANIHKVVLECMFQF